MLDFLGFDAPTQVDAPSGSAEFVECNLDAPDFSHEMAVEEYLLSAESQSVQGLSDAVVAQPSSYGSC